jgi:hypothetical protein
MSRVAGFWKKSSTLARGPPLPTYQGASWANAARQVKVSNGVKIR